MSLILPLIITLYGFLAAATYIAVSKMSAQPITYLPIVSGIGLILLIPFSKKKHFYTELSSINLMRPIVFTIGQILIVVSLSNHTPLSAFYSAATGAAVAVVLGRAFLGEKVQIPQAIGLIIVLAGSFGFARSTSLTPLALLAGLIQGIGVVLARKRTLDGAHAVSMASASLFSLFVCSALYSLSTARWIASDGVHVQSLLIAGAGFGILQLSYCLLAGKLPSWMLALSSNSRIPASLLLGSWIGDNSLTPQAMLYSLVITAGMVAVVAGKAPSHSTSTIS